MRPVIIAAVVAATLALVTGCSSGGGPASEEEEMSTSKSATSASADSFCTAYCQKLSSCDSSQDAQTCTETCETEISTIVKKLRTDVIADTQACWTSRSDCRQVLSSTRFGECLDEAAVTATPTAAAKSFCDAFGTALRKCDVDSNYATCLSGAKVFGDETLEQAQKCTEKSCSAISSCLKATL